MEQIRYEQRTVNPEKDEYQIIRKTSSEHHAPHPVSAEILRLPCKAAPFFPHSTHESGTTVEHNLLQYHHERHVYEEHGERYCRVVPKKRVILHRLYQLRGILSDISRCGVPLGLNLMHLIQHHLIGGDGHILIVQERGHIGISRNHALTHIDKIIVKILWNIDDSVHFLRFHQMLRFLH